jgi:hypothetical protein
MRDRNLPRFDRDATGAAHSRTGSSLLARANARLLLGAGLVIMTLAVLCFATGTRRPASSKQPASGANSGKAQGKSEPTVIKRPLPPDVAEEDVPKWIVHRQVSGRTELEPWDSIDGWCVRDPEALDAILAPKTRSLADEESRDRADEARWASPNDDEEGRDEEQSLSEDATKPAPKAGEEAALSTAEPTAQEPAADGPASPSAEAPQVEAGDDSSTPPAEAEAPAVDTPG